MKCQCPACGRTMRLQPDMLEFLVRCERCKTYLLPRSAAESESSLAAAPANLQILPLGAVGDRPAAGGPHLDKLLTRRPESRRATPVVRRDIAPTLAEMARGLKLAEAPAAAASRRPTSHSKRAAVRGAFILWTVLTAALIAALFLAAHHWMLRSAFAQEPRASTSDAPASLFPRPALQSGLTTTSHTSATTDAPSAAASQSPSTSAAPATGTGELFPAISPTR